MGAEGRKAYAAPELKVFGPVGMLTQSGTGVMVENSNIVMGVLMCGMNTKAQMC